MSKILVHLVTTNRTNISYLIQAVEAVDSTAKVIEHDSVESYFQYRAIENCCTVVITDFEKSRFRKGQRRFASVIQYSTNPATANTMPAINSWNSSPVYLAEIQQHLTEAFASVRLYEKLRASATRLPTLNERERRVVLLASEGVPNKSIARRLDVSVKTVEKSRRNAYNKLMVNSSAEVASLVTFGRFFVDYPTRPLTPTSHLPTSPTTALPNPMLS